MISSTALLCCILSLSSPALGLRINSQSKVNLKNDPLKETQEVSESNFFSEELDGVDVNANLYDMQVDDIIRSLGRAPSFVFSEPNPPQLLSQEGPYDPEPAGITFHKTGTYLQMNIHQKIAKALGKQFYYHNTGIPRRQLEPGCRKDTVFVYTGCGHPKYPDVKIPALTDECPNARSVLMVRDPVAQVVSGYLYHKVSFDQMGGWDPKGPEKYANMTLAEGLSYEARRMVPLLNSISECLPKAKARPSILVMGLEEFTEDFDGSLTKMFEHYFSSQFTDSEKLNTAWKQSSKYDNVNKWSEDTKKNYDHVAHKDEVASTLDAFWKLYKSGDPDIKAIVDFRAPLGYTE